MATWLVAALELTFKTEQLPCYINEAVGKRSKVVLAQVRQPKTSYSYLDIGHT